MKDFDSNKELKELDKFFAETLKDVSVKPSEDVWMNIEAELDNKSKKRFLFWMIPTAILLITLSVGYFLMSDNYFSSPSTAQNIRSDSKEPLSSDADNSTSKISTIANTETDTSQPGIKTTSEKPNDTQAEKKSNEPLVLKNLAYENKPQSKIISGSEKTKPRYNSSQTKTPLNTEPKHKKITRAGETKASQEKTEPINRVESAVIVEKNNSQINSEESEPKKDHVSENKPSAKNENEKTKENRIETNGNNSQAKIEEPASSNPTAAIEKPVVQNIVTAVTQNTTAATTPSLAATAQTPKKDTLNKEKTTPPKADTTSIVKTPEPEKSKDTFKRFGVYVLAGPEYAKPISTSFKEVNPITFIGAAKFQYLVTKRFAVEVGASYQTAKSSSSDDTLYFQKNLTYDTYIHSSYGDMVVDPATLMQGFSTTGPFTNYRVKYSYKINYSALNIPLLFKFYPVKRDKISVSVMVGINTQKIISQSTQLTIYREFNNNSTLNYTNLLSNSLSYSAIIGLGFEVKAYRNLNFVLEPNLRYGLKNLSSSSAAKAKMLNLDGHAGLKLNF